MIGYSNDVSLIRLHSFIKSHAQSTLGLNPLKLIAASGISNASTFVP